MIERVETYTRGEFTDVAGQVVGADIRQLGIRTVEAVQAIRVFLLEGELSREAVERIARELLADAVTEGYYVGCSPAPAGLAAATLVEVHLRPGVMDPVAASCEMAIADLGLGRVRVRTARKYVLLGRLTEKQKRVIAQRVLANDCIETVLFGEGQEPPAPRGERYRLQVVEVALRGLNEGELEGLSRERDLFLNGAEMRAIQGYYQRLGREPRDVELEMLAQTWSEHCVHKTFRGTIEYTEKANGSARREVIENLLKSTIMRATRELNREWCLSVFRDNSGVIEFDEERAACFKVETHNHPSAIEPYGGAATGIGGCIRDPMGTGLGAKPVANTDVFCFAPPDTALEALPAGVLHPRRVMKGVVAGVRDYGNRMGIPTVNGAVLFDERYLGNPLVYCGTVGLMRKEHVSGRARAGDLIVVVGGRTGRDGIHGATFSSGEMTHEHERLFSHAVQIGNAITEKKMLDTLLEARDGGLYVAITDCGAGGLSSAVGEMGGELGAEVDLERAPLKYEGLSYTEIWISEAQERMVIAAPPEQRERLLAVFAAEDVEATVIGRFREDRRLILRYEGQVVGEMEMEFLHEGLPQTVRQAVWEAPELAEPELAEKGDYTEDLKRILGDYNVASKEWVVRQYDHEVQGGSAVKPLVGAGNDGPGDAAVVRPAAGTERGLAIGCGICPQYSDLDPYWMALAAIDEAVRNVTVVGADPGRTALLDNFCWGNCDKPDRLGGLVRAAQGCYQGATAYGAPFISGKDSLNNEFQTEGGETISIPGTLLISALGIVEDVNRCVTMDAKRAGDVIVVVGETRNELGGSRYYRVHGALGANVPRVDLRAGPQAARAVARAIQLGLVAACHDCSEGGLAAALAEMALAGELGMEVELAGVPVGREVGRTDQVLFSETPSRYVLEAAPEKLGALAQVLREVRFGEVGRVTDDGRLVIRDEGRAVVIDAAVAELKEVWQRPLRW